MIRALAAGNVICAITLLAVALLVDQPPATRVIGLVIAAGNAFGAVACWWMLRRQRAAQTTLWPDGADFHAWSYRQLVAKHDEGQRLTNEGSPAAPGDEALHVLHAVEEELRRRGVPLCVCGAPLPDGVHLTNCPEKS